MEQTLDIIVLPTKIIIFENNTNYIYTKILIITNLCFLLIVVIDIGSGCQSATFTLNDDSTVSRAWDIKISQFACGDIDSGGPPGCLQYYKETYGIIQRLLE